MTQKIHQCTLNRMSALFYMLYNSVVSRLSRRHTYTTSISVVGACDHFAARIPFPHKRTDFGCRWLQLENLTVFNPGISILRIPVFMLRSTERPTAVHVVFRIVSVSDKVRKGVTCERENSYLTAMVCSQAYLYLCVCRLQRHS